MLRPEWAETFARILLLESKCGGQNNVVPADKRELRRLQETNNALP